MCGIAGSISSGADNDAGTAAQLCALLRHRGPDGEGHFADDHVALSMRRLAIIDLEGAAQPIHSRDDRYVLVANGEIYNHVELRAEMAAAGVDFVTNGDVETILHAYAMEGEAGVSRLRGMFAFALWDRAQRRLVLGRDRMGEKPLYLVERPGGLTFCSELRALVAAGVAPVDLDPVSVHEYFHYSYVPEPRTPLKGVRKLPAGHLLTIDVDGWVVEQRRYWDLLSCPPIDADPASEIGRVLDETGRLIIRSDVPVGVALSGGLDSSIVAALAVRHADRPLTAFTVGYSGRPATDERDDAIALARHLDLPVQEIEINENAIPESFESLIAERDDPIADISGEGYRAVMRAARDADVPVLLLGQGGDELFWGYEWARRAVELAERKQRGEDVNSLLDTPAPSGRLRRLLSSWRSAHRSRPPQAADDRLPFYDVAPVFRSAEGQVEQLYSKSWRQALAGVDPGALFRVPRPWDRPDLLVTDLLCSTYLLENGMTQADRLGMSSSVETRLPLVDYRLAETVIGLRKAQRDDHLSAKSWLKAAAADLLPSWVLSRPKKGFTPPTDQWHRRIFDSLGGRLENGRLVSHQVLAAPAASQLSKGPFPSQSVVPLSFKALVLELWVRDLEALAARHAASKRATA
ncbi:asparagine synthase (glutamine-hydrolyzing) [Rhodospira trueperi]|uniref:asparagine synthase (glutamine-hydrolyzing) n=1 Tax=Rhodospira trueperi TaxID=69960 RepID=A0A1G7GRJ4_9PROT|nr:asparagine synthase (glutamine-hydrolyzing) [Rhodospira trueperi]SDE90589.1 asparagine synthase (glutamine-hydrolysing) [Rhodospira trueperi]